MIQMQALNYIINKNDVELLQMYGPEYYWNYPDAYDFIFKHWQQFKQVPAMATMVSEFDKEHFEDLKESYGSSDESREYIVRKLYGEKIAYEATRIVDESGPEWGVDAEMALANLKMKLASIPPRPNKQFGVDIVQTAPDRYNALIDRRNNPENYWFPTGLDDLDLSIEGIRRREELLVIFARTNNLKSWLAEKMAVAVWEAGYNVGFFSPEMSADSVGYRFDTLYKHWDNKGIQGADKYFDPAKYKTYCSNLPKNKALFNVTNPATFNKQVTVTALKRWVLELNLQMIVLDGITYLANERCMNGKQNTTERLTEISEDLMSLSVELGIPIIVVVQANREAARDKDGDVNNEAPELDTIRGSDGISHNASRVFSIIHKKSKEDGDTITIYVNKNRYGPVGQKLIWAVKINTGEFTYVPNPKDGFEHPEMATATKNANEEYKDAEEDF